MRELAFRYGENNRGFGMMTLAINAEDAPVVVMLNAGLLHRAEPYRLNLLASRRLTEIGYICLRVDIAGKGDTPARDGLTNRQSVALDWQYIKDALVHQFGERNIIIMGLCSGADNAIKIAAKDRSVKGLILMDPVSKKDQGFRKRALLNKMSNVYKWLNLLKTLFKKLSNPGNVKESHYGINTTLRDEPYDEDLRQCFTNLVSIDGRILAIFTGFAFDYYNQKGQFARSMSINGLEQICEEIFWPNVLHLYPVQVHRDRLLAAIADWCTTHFELLRKKEPL